MTVDIETVNEIKEEISRREISIACFALTGQQKNNTERTDGHDLL